MPLSTEEILAVVNNVNQEYEVYEHRRQLSLIISPEHLKQVCMELRDNQASQFDMLIDITATDFLTREKRFETVYFLYSNIFKSRLRLKVPLSGEFPHCPSVVDIWESANWYERETYDMYGVVFDGHPNLRRFYMPEDYADPETGEPIYPLRKDFPLMGVPDSLPLPNYPEKREHNN